MNSTKSQIKEFKSVIGNIVTDILAEGTYDDFMSLQDAKTCNSHTIFLEDELRQRFKKVQIREFAQGIYISPNKHKPCKDEKCSNIEEPKYGLLGNLKSKAQICRAISVYYVRIFNLIGAIMAAIDPENNMCLRRLNALYKPLSDSPGKGQINICNEDKQLYPDNFLGVEGMKELLNLYQMYNVEGLKSQHESMKSEIVELQKKIKIYFKGAHPTSNNETNDEDNNNEENNNNENNNNENIKDKIAKLQNKLSKKKGANGNANRANANANRANANRANANGANANRAKANANANRAKANANANRANANRARANGNGANANRANGNGAKANGVNVNANPMLGVNANRANANANPMLGVNANQMPGVNANKANANPMPGVNANPMPAASANPMPGAIDMLPGGIPPAAGELNVSESNSSESLTGGRRTKKLRKNGNKKSKQRGGGFFQRMLGLEDDNKPSADSNLPTVDTNVNPAENIEVAREDLKTLKDFKEFMKKRKIPDNVLAEGSKISIPDFPKNLHKLKECSAEGDKKLNRIVSFTEPGAFEEYINNYKVINEHYKKETQTLKEILTEKILKKTNNRYTVQDITSEDLLGIEKNTRETLLNYYTNCQSLFSTSFKSLVSGVNKSILAKEAIKLQEEEKKLNSEA